MIDWHEIIVNTNSEDFGTVHPTVGFSRSEVSVKKYKLTVYDLGGSQRIRDIWSTYFAEASDWLLSWVKGRYNRCTVLCSL